MLIIFDLDDTLIDTSGSIVPFKMKLCLQRLQVLGIKIHEFAKSYQELMEINAVSLSSSDALKEFIIKNKGDLAWLKSLAKELFSPLPEDFEIPTTPDAKEILEELGLRHHLALVTAGDFRFQKEKLKKAGIEPSVFSNILIPEDCIKLPSYEALCKQFLNEKVLVCGDRVNADLLPAYQLGATTVHMQWGRGLLNQAQPWVDYSIRGLRELRDIVR